MNVHKSTYLEFNLFNETSLRVHMIKVAIGLLDRRFACRTSDSSHGYFLALKANLHPLGHSVRFDNMPTIQLDVARIFVFSSQHDIPQMVIIGQTQAALRWTWISAETNTGMTTRKYLRTGLSARLIRARFGTERFTLLVDAVSHTRLSARRAWFTAAFLTYRVSAFVIASLPAWRANLGTWLRAEMSTDQHFPTFTTTRNMQSALIALSTRPL